MFKLLNLAAVGVVLVALSSSSAFAQTISPSDNVAVTGAASGSLTAVPLGLYGLSVDWLALGANPLDLAAVGPTMTPLADPPATGGNLAVGNPMTCPNAQYPTIQSPPPAPPARGEIPVAATPSPAPTPQPPTTKTGAPAASPGAHIMVSPGTYVEEVTTPADKDALTLQSKNPLAAIIQAPAVMAPPK